MATLLAGLSLPVLALTLGWRWAFGIVALAAVGVIAFGWLRRGGSAPRRSRDSSIPRASGLARRSRPTELYLLAGAAMFGIWGGQAMGTFLVSYAVSLGQPPATAGLILTAASVAGITARIATGWLIDRRASSGVGELQVLLAIGSVGLGLIAIGMPLIVWLGPMLAFAGGWGWSGVLTYVAVRLDPDAPAAATGITQAGVFLGATIGLPLFGVIVEATSYSVAWAATIVTMTLALVLVRIAGRRAGPIAAA
jgi:predicted MFS family arabinose efflux permease